MADDTDRPDSDYVLSATADGIPLGADVYTSDGDHLGKVKAVEGEAFKVDAPMALDYWLALRNARVEDDVVRLRFDTEQLGTIKLGSAAEAGNPLAADPDLAAGDAGEPILSDGATSAALVGLSTAGVPQSDIEMPGGTDPLHEPIADEEGREARR